MEFESESNLLLQKIRFHKRKYGGQGSGVNEEEGIHQRVRQGVGGSSELVVDADVIGHLHVGIDWHPNTGDIIETNGHQVKLNSRANKECYNQVGEDEMGFSFDGVIVK